MENYHVVRFDRDIFDACLRQLSDRALPNDGDVEAVVLVGFDGFGKYAVFGFELSGALRPENCRKNASGEMEISFDQAEKAIRFSARFAPTVNDRWFYPEYVLHLPEESLAGAIGISFETKAVPPYDIRQMLVMAVPGTEKEVYYQFAVSPGNDWSDAYKVEKPMEAGLDAKWECAGAQRAVSVTENGWTVELFLPFSGMHQRKAPRAYQTWFGNLVNNKLGADRKPVEYSGYSMTMGNNHNHSLWGKFKFMGKGD